MLWLVALGACGFTVNPGTGGGGSDAGGDAPRDAAGGDATDGAVDAPLDTPQPPMQCMASGTSDTFQGNTPCSPWATFDSTGGAQTTQSGGKLRVAEPTASTGATHGGCIQIGTAAWGPEGAFIRVEQALAGLGSYTALTAYVASGTPATIVVENGTLIVRAPGGMTVASKVYDAQQMQWWRLRPVAGGVIGETSPDALTWNAIGMVPGPPPAMIRIDISAGTSGVQAAAGTAVFDNLNVCP